MPITDHQADVKKELFTNIRNGQKRVILEGAAGTGKTFLTADIVHDLKRDYAINNNYNNGLIYVTAPTNKALAVLQSKIPAGRGIEFKTIHAALKLKRIINDRTGEESYIPTNQGYNDDFKNCRGAVLDESSMASSQILSFLSDYHFPIIFVGDRNQINPVGELDTPVFHKNYPISNLTEIIRQGKGNPIIDLSRDLDLIYFKEPNVIDGKGYIYDNNLDAIIDSLAEVNGTDEFKYLAWTNKQIDLVNAMVRVRRYGKPRRIEKGETVVFNSPLDSFYTNQEVLVEDFDIVTDYVPVPRYDTKYDSMNKPVGKVDFIKLKFYRINNAFSVIHEDSDGIYRGILSAIQNSCKKFGWKWRGYFYFKEIFADIKYNHALSIHKSQGSTFKTSVLNIENIGFNKNAEERTRLLYTGVTRSSDLVILNNVR